MALILMLTPVGLLLKPEHKGAPEDARDVYAYTGGGWKRMATVYSDDDAEIEAAELERIGFEVEIR